MTLNLTILRLATSLCMLSSAWQFWRFSNKTFSWLFIDFEMSEPRCAIVVNSMIIILIISAILVWIDKSWAICLTLLGALVLLIEASAQSFYPPESSALYNLPCHALRYLLPFGLLLIHHKKYKASETLLAIATGITFFGHGMKALLNELIFQDFILAFFFRYWPAHRICNKSYAFACYWNH